MDIWLINAGEATQIQPKSIHGMLWLQTHFEEEHWDLIANDQVRIANNEALELMKDAKNAGLILNYLPTFYSKVGK